MRCCVVFCLMFICFEFGIVDGLKSSQKGVCVSKHTVTKTRPKTVLVPTGKWCGPKKCTVKQTRKQKYTVVTNQLMCCKGFVYTSETDSCAPVCSTGCANGTCADPDVCHCEAPLYLDPTTKNKCLTPTCDYACINGMCTANNTCLCVENFVYFNATHCVENCTAGFKLDSSLNCVPNCECNGKCSPDKCVCLPGYENGTCQPQCDRCVNARCVAPDTCECDKGFVKKNASVCERSCGECRANGTCLTMTTETKTRPVTYNATVPCKGRKGKCTEIKTKYEEYEEEVTLEICCVSYNWIPDRDVCEPNCEGGCMNGTCVAPDVCVCDPPLILNDTAAVHTCVPPICDQPCVRGTCTANNKCTCDDGYTIQDTYTCVAQCTNCTNGECIRPNVCNCHAGYLMKDGQCTLQCESCNNGVCSAPNICTCNDGYELKDNKCKPVCKNSCVNGDCVAPDHCQCKEGYEAKSGNKEVCIPKCKSDCSNGFCSAPNVCTCNDGYEFKDNKCKPLCKKPCVYGKCIAPNTCKCFDSYESKGKNKEVCVPKCKSDCSNGFCSAPNVCTCNDGYEFKDNKCKPICKKPCVYGECVAPGTCTCFDGYESKGKHKEVCVPKCNNDCSNGICSGPDVCICNPGYELKENKCKPVCDKSCVNATCVAPNTCSCIEGFEKSEHEETCKPKCKLCTHGVCIAPDKCECKKGYAFTDKGCLPTCKETCVNAYCSAPNECSCNDGYTRDALNSSVCSKPCGICNRGTCKNGECVCEAEMDLVNGTCVVSTPGEISGITANTGLASVQMTWLVGGAVVLLLTVLVLVVMSRLWHKRKDLPQKADDRQQGSVLTCIVPNTLFQKDDLAEEEEEPSDTLLDKETNVV